MADTTRLTSCGVLVVAHGDRILLGQATGTRRWDIPKGQAEPGEAWPDAAARELEEETGLRASPPSLELIGRFDYLPRKDLVLFAWRPPMPIDPAGLHCRSTFLARDGRALPEMARFEIVVWDEALARVGKSLAAVLSTLDHARLFDARLLDR